MTSYGTIGLILRFYRRHGRQPSKARHGFSTLTHCNANSILVILCGARRQGVGVLALRGLFCDHGLAFATIGRSGIKRFSGTLILVKVFVVFIGSSYRGFHRKYMIVLSFGTFSFGLSMDQFRQFTIFVGGRAHGVFDTYGI